MRRKKDTNPKISKKLTLMMALIATSIVSILIWLDGEQKKFASVDQSQYTIEKAGNDSEIEAANACQAHYYEGEAEVKGWLIGADGENLVVQVIPADFEKLPKASNITSNDKVKLVDASVDVQKILKTSTSDNPVSITIRGCATVCDSTMPLVSLAPATKAFKKS